MKLQLLKEQVANRHLLNKLLDDNVKLLYNIYTGAGYEMRIVGGAVRDILSGNTPKDIDLASDATPEESMQLLDNNGISVKDVENEDVGRLHGVIIASLGGENYEIATLRIDTETDGRHAKVQFTKNWEQDAARRDLTFNAMSMDFDGKIYDYFGGREDLKKGVARFVGDASTRIDEDFIRILRYFRFQGRVKSPVIDDDTVSVIKNKVDGLHGIPNEPIGKEMMKILKGNHLDKLLPIMNETGVFNIVGPERPNIKEAIKISKNTSDPRLIAAALLQSPSESLKLKKSWMLNNDDFRVINFITNNRDNLDTPEIMHFVTYETKQFHNIKKLLEYRGDKKRLAYWDKFENTPMPVLGRDLKPLIGEGPQVRDAMKKLAKVWVNSNYKLSKKELIDKL